MSIQKKTKDQKKKNDKYGTIMKSDPTVFVTHCGNS